MPNEPEPEAYVKCVFCGDLTPLTGHDAVCVPCSNAAEGSILD
jgi:hypothetical protein